MTSDLQSALALAGPLLPNALVFLTGSHMFGLQTPESDEDYTVIYFDPEDDRRMFRKYPEVLHSDTNDQKLYSLRKWSSLLAKGNPNVCEMVNLAHMPLGEDDGTRFLTRNRFSIRRLFTVVYPLVATQALAAAYMGHLQGLMKELAVGKYDASRTAHGFRVAYSAQHLFETGTLPDFRDLHEAREVALSVKQGETTGVWAIAELKLLDASLGPVYAKIKSDLPTTEPLREAINKFFVEVHA